RPGGAAQNAHLGGHLAAGTYPVRNCLVVEVIGVILGGFIGALSAGRFRFDVERGPRITVRARLGYALAGGVIMGFAAGLARGCTSGQALSGGATLATGSWRSEEHTSELQARGNLV